MRPQTAAMLSLALGIQALAQDQYALRFDVQDDTLLPGQSTSITLAAAYGSNWALATVGTELVASTGSDGLSDWALIAPLDGPGTTPGALSATGVDGILAGQLNFPPAGHWEPQPNPIPFWTATYTAPTDVAAPFDVTLLTQTSRFEVYISRDDPVGRSRLDDLVEGSAVIRVIPAPASALVLVGLPAITTRRRSG
ncbi:MAG: hypothetical protein HRU13_10720 [Phycisphaerales bacterium]|nr:hypothetical protein [Phycisphaerales bacterium]